MATRTLQKLNDLAIKARTAPGLLSDGGKLYLRVSSATQKSWVFIYQWDGRAKEMGLGSLADVSLAEARKRRQAQVDLLAAGINPIEERDRLRAAKLATLNAAPAITLRVAAPLVLAVSGINTDKGQANFLRSCLVHSGAMADMALQDITTDHVVTALEVYWTSQPETADRLRKRVEACWDWASAKKHVTGENPARLGVLKFLLERRKVRVAHRASISFKDAAKALTALRAVEGRMAALAAEWIILTAVRCSEGRLARRSEIDRAAKVWVIPAERMKMREEHRVPLSTQAMALLEKLDGLPVISDPDLLFESAMKPGVAVSDGAIRRYVGEATGDEAVTHGWRATFKDWSLDIGGVNDRVGEECLAHVIGNKTRNSYRHEDNLEGRRPVMQAWADFLAKPWVENVTPITATAARAA